MDELEAMSSHIMTEFDQGKDTEIDSLLRLFTRMVL